MQRNLWIGFVFMALAICILFITSKVGQILFNRTVEKEMDALVERSKSVGEVNWDTDLSRLPEPVAEWLLKAGVDGQEYVRIVKLKQDGEMRLAVDKTWIPVSANQMFTTAEPGFVWDAKINMAPGIYLKGMDRYSGGQGSMLIRLMSIITVADAKGPEVDQGTLLRFLAETAWFPTAALSDYITWESIDGKSAKATMKYGRTSATGIFEFNEDGNIAGFTAKRFMEKDGNYSFENWKVVLDEHENLGGYIVPAKAKVIWELEDGDFEWFRCDVTEIEYE